MRFYSKDGYKLRQFRNVREVEEQLRLPLKECWEGKSEPPTDEKIKRDTKWYGFPDQESEMTSLDAIPNLMSRVYTQMSAGSCSVCLIIWSRKCS